MPDEKRDITEVERTFSIEPETYFLSGMIGEQRCANCGHRQGHHRALDLACPHGDNFLPRKFLETKFKGAD